jgi:hypothetical protein
VVGTNEVAFRRNGCWCVGCRAAARGEGLDAEFGNTACTRQAEAPYQWRRGQYQKTVGAGVGAALQLVRKAGTELSKTLKPGQWVQEGRVRRRASAASKHKRPAQQTNEETGAEAALRRPAERVEAGRVWQVVERDVRRALGACHK